MKTASLSEILISVITGAARGVLAALARRRVATAPTGRRRGRPPLPRPVPVDPRAADFEQLVHLIVRDMEATLLCSPKLKAYTFTDLVDMCRRNSIFAEYLKSEVTIAVLRSTLGLYFNAKFRAQTIHLPHGRRLCLNLRGRNRHKKFTAELI